MFAKCYSRRFTKATIIPENSSYVADLVELESIVTQWHEYRRARERSSTLFSFVSECRVVLVHCMPNSALLPTAFASDL